MGQTAKNTLGSTRSGVMGQRQGPALLQDEEDDSLSTLDEDESLPLPSDSDSGGRS